MQIALRVLYQHDEHFGNLVLTAHGCETDEGLPIVAQHRLAVAARQGSLIRSPYYPPNELESHGAHGAEFLFQYE